MKIRKKTFMLVFACIAICILSGIVCNHLFLEKYYLYKTEKEFVSASQAIQKQLEEESGDIDAYIGKAADENDSRIILFDKNWNIVAVSYYQREDSSNIPLKKIQKMEKERENRTYICEIFDMKKDSYSKIIFLSETKQEQYLVLMRNTNGMRESAAIANEFYLLIGGLLLLAGAIAAILFSGKITVPILEICEIASEVSEFRFEHKIAEKGTDEISKLAHSINVMSDKLENSIHALNEDILQRKQLVRDISHELKSPIAVIQGYADGLIYGVAEDEIKRERYCQVIVSECERMDEMVKDLLELSKLEQIAVQTDLEKIELYPFLHTLVQKYEKTIDEKKCDLLIFCDAAMSVTSDKKLLERVMVNLLNNAVNYVEESGKVMVEVIDEKEQIEVSVFNSGSHIEDEDMDKIWNVFYKADQARSRRKGGHGIGLAIVKTIVELMNGTVFVQNQDDGVKFGFYLYKTSL